MPVIHAGAQIERPPGPKYREALRFAEIVLPGPLPRVSKLESWRKGLDRDFAFALVAPRPTMVSAKGPLRFDDELEHAIDWLTEAADALEARAIVLATGADITTGRRDRDHLGAYLERLRSSSERPLVWAPKGLWEPDEATAEAERLGVVYGFDPLEAEVPAGPLAYGRLKAIGARRRFTDGMLEEVADKIATSGAHNAYVAIESPRSFREARTLEALAGALTAGG